MATRAKRAQEGRSQKTADARRAQQNRQRRPSAPLSPGRFGRQVVRRHAHGMLVGVGRARAGQPLGKSKTPHEPHRGQRKLSKGRRAPLYMTSADLRGWTNPWPWTYKGKPVTPGSRAER